MSSPVCSAKVGRCPVSVAFIYPLYVMLAMVLNTMSDSFRDPSIQNVYPASKRERHRHGRRSVKPGSVGGSAAPACQDGHEPAPKTVGALP